MAAIPNAGEAVEKLALSYIAGGHENGTAMLGNSLIICLKKPDKRILTAICISLGSPENQGWCSLQMEGWVGGWVDGWVDGWMDGWVGGWMDGWMDVEGVLGQETSAYYHHHSKIRSSKTYQWMPNPSKNVQDHFHGVKVSPTDCLLVGQEK